MQAEDLQRYLHDHIPLSKAMQVSVIECGEDSVVISAPLVPNVNHQGTVFGGSASAVAMLAGWSLLHVRLRNAGIANNLVIQQLIMNYARPISGGFMARASLERPQDWSGFTQMLARKGRARIGVAAQLEQAGHSAARFTGIFVASAADLAS